MIRLKSLLCRLFNDRRGITAIEYAVLAGGISVALVAVFTADDGGIFAVLNTKLAAIIDAIPTN